MNLKPDLNKLEISASNILKNKSKDYLNKVKSTNSFKKEKFNPAIFIEIESIHPKDCIPINDNFTLNIKHNNKLIIECFPIENILGFIIDSNLNNTIEFTFKVNKGPLSLYEGKFDLSKLVFLNKETLLIKSFSLLPNISNKKLIVCLKDIYSLKLDIKIKIIYNENDLNTFVNNNKNSKLIHNKKLITTNKSKLSLISKNNNDNNNNIIIDNNIIDNKSLKSRSNKGILIKNKTFNKKSLTVKKAVDSNQVKLFETSIDLYNKDNFDNYDNEISSDYDKDLDNDKDILDNNKNIDINTSYNLNTIKNHSLKIEDKEFNSINVNLKNAVINFESLPCAKFSKIISEQFFKLENLYFEKFKRQMNVYNKVKNLMNKYNEDYRKYTKMLYKCKNLIKDIDNQFGFQSYVCKNELSSLSFQSDIFNQQIDLFKNILKINTNHNNDNIQFKKQLFSMKTNQEKELIKLVLETLSKKPDLYTKLGERLFYILNEHSKVFNVNIRIPPERIIDRIDEEPEISIVST